MSFPLVWGCKREGGVVSYTWDVFISYRRTRNVTGFVLNHLRPVLEAGLEDQMGIRLESSWTTIWRSAVTGLTSWHRPCWERGTCLLSGLRHTSRLIGA